MKKLITTLIIFFCVNISFAQSYIDIFKLSLSTTPPNQFDSSINSTRIKETSADLNLPVKINDKLAILTGGIFEHIQTKVFENQSSINIYSIGIKAGINKNIGEHWSASFILLPKISSNFHHLAKQGFQIGGITLFKYSKTEHLNYKLALYYNSELFGPILVPMFGMYRLTSDKKWETNLMLPLQADINYKISSNIRLGLNYNGQIRTYHLSNTKPLNYNTYLSRTNNELCAYIRMGVTKTLNIQAKAGYSLGRSYRVYNENDKVNFALPLLYFNDNRKQLNTDFENGIIFQFQMFYRFDVK